MKRTIMIVTNGMNVYSMNELMDCGLHPVKRPMIKRATESRQISQTEEQATIRRRLRVPEGTRFFAEFRPSGFILSFSVFGATCGTAMQPLGSCFSGSLEFQIQDICGAEDIAILDSDFAFSLYFRTVQHCSIGVIEVFDEEVFVSHRERDLEVSP